jgi:hypothetical protein
MKGAEPMKPIKQIAYEIGVSEQEVYERYKGKLYKSVLPYARKANGTTYILEQGERIIKQDFLNDTAYSGVHTGYTQDMLVALEKISNQLENLTATIKTQAESVAYKPRRKRYNFNEKPPIETKPSAPIKRLMVRGK